MFLPPMDVEFFKSTEWEFYAKGTVRMLDAQHDTTTLCQAVDAQDETHARFLRDVFTPNGCGTF
jgi:hypothetical protein